METKSPNDDHCNSRLTEEIKELTVPSYPTPGRLTIIALTCSISGFLSGLDQTILATAIPQITNDFHTLNGIAWWTSSYLLTSATFQLVYGRCNTLFPVKFVYMSANALFALGSLICTVAPNSVALIAGRAIAGVGVAGIMSGNVLIIAASAPLARRASLTGMMFAFLGLASLVGPFIGGVLTDRATWRWCFGINLPISAMVIASTALFVNTPLPPRAQTMTLSEKIRHFNVPGTALLTLSFFCLIFALQRGASDSWRDHAVIALLVLFVVLFAAFGLWTYMSGQGIEPPLRYRDVWFTSIYAGCVSGGMFVPITYMPVWFQAVIGASAIRSGVMITPLIAAFVAMSIISGVTTEHVSYYNPAMLLGVVLSAVGGGLMATLKPLATQSMWVGYQMLYGFGAGAGVPPPMLVIQTVLPEEDIPMGVAIVSLSQMLWSAVVVAIAQPIFEGELKSALRHKLPGINIETQINAGARELAKTYPPEQLETVISAYSDAIVKVFHITVALSCVAFPCALLIRWKSMTSKTDAATPGEQESEKVRP
ncbi:MFS general substrate transporter [Ophiobolus disseminans]|uniref:MFS general substrate transporter n=1 Tax=Ophiobolus disseminans TaxID=1469910 RepID=A0A6A7AEJ9_9PLEO|nr:MFS general substrate transporter [Ophiobolus disseminans]